MRPVFADPKTDFVFKKLFGTEANKPLLISLLNALLGLKGEHLIADVIYLREEERPVVQELKNSIVDVKCRDQRGTVFIVEMQVLRVEGFEKRVVYGASKAYVNQLGSGGNYPELDDVIAVTICNFELWPDAPGQPRVPLVSHWRMQEQQHGRLGLSHVQYVFVELPKLKLDQLPADEAEEWAYVFNQAQQLTSIPPFLAASGPKRALDVSRTTHFTEAEWEAYDRMKISEQDARGAFSYATRKAKEEGHTEGRVEAKQEMLLSLFEERGLPVTEAQRATIRTCQDLAQLDRWFKKAITAPTVEAALSLPPSAE